jgi:hypothetical protein
MSYAVPRECPRRNPAITTKRQERAPTCSGQIFVIDGKQTFIDRDNLGPPGLSARRHRGRAANLELTSRCAALPSCGGLAFRGLRFHGRGDESLANGGWGAALRGEEGDASRAVRRSAPAWFGLRLRSKAPPRRRQAWRRRASTPSISHPPFDRPRETRFSRRYPVSSALSATARPLYDFLRSLSHPCSCESRAAP